MKPSIDLAKLEGLDQQWADYRAAARQSDDEATCPKCQHTFRIGGELPPKPDVALETVKAELKAHAVWVDDIVLPDGPDLTPAQINHCRHARAAKQRYNEAHEQLKGFQPMVDPSPELATMQQAAAEWKSYDQAAARAAEQLELNAKVEAELRKLGDLPPLDAVEKLIEELHLAQTYEAAVLRYQQEQEQFNERTAEVKHETTMAEAWAEGAKALTDARTELKTVLTPLLSMTASELINEMSNGDFKSVVVDEDMEITVDGRRIETLSGAGVTVANIALRLGLGQVLVKNVFPVFLGDEMDSDADAVRSMATIAALRNLRGRLQQIILITHRGIEDVDMVVNLSE